MKRTYEKLATAQKRLPILKSVKNHIAHSPQGRGEGKKPGWKLLLDRLQLPRLPKRVCWVAICVAFTWIAGCQSFLQSKKNKEQISREKFSCGEKIPGRMP